MSHFRQSDRDTQYLLPPSMDEWLPKDHLARFVVDIVEQLDLSALTRQYRGAGSAAYHPAVLLALLIYGYATGTFGSRRIEQASHDSVAFRYIAANTHPDHDTLCAFRKRFLPEIERLFVGLEEARAQVETLQQQIEDDPGALTRRQQAARERAIRERQERIEKAVKRLPELEKLKEKSGKKPEEARASSTDAEATVMKMGDGGFRPAYNAQYATDTESQVIVGVEVVTVGSDMGQLAPMVGQVTERCGESPEQWLVDGGYPAHAQLDTVVENTCVYAPVPKPKDEAIDPHASKPGDSEAVAAWRKRMGTEEAKALYKDRAATAECVNALARERGLTRLRVRGKSKVRSVLLLHALAHNLMRSFALAPELLGLGTGAPEMAEMTG